MYLDAYAAATTDLGRGRMESHHYLKEACTIMKPEHGANALARGPPVLTWSGLGAAEMPRQPWATVCVLTTHHRGAPASQFFQHASSTWTSRAFPGDPPGRPVFVSADRTHPQSTISNNEVKQNASRKD